MNAPSSEPASNPSFIQRVWKNTQVILEHTIGFTVLTLAIWGYDHFFLKFTLGTDWKLFDRLPIVYISHCGDLLIMVRLSWNLIKDSE